VFTADQRLPQTCFWSCYKALCYHAKTTNVHIYRASVHQVAKLVAALLRVAGVTAGVAESNGSLSPGVWLTSPAAWLPRTEISSGTLRSVIEYGLQSTITFTKSAIYAVIECWQRQLHIISAPNARHAVWTYPTVCCRLLSRPLGSREHNKIQTTSSVTD